MLQSNSAALSFTCPNNSSNDKIVSIHATINMTVLGQFVIHNHDWLWHSRTSPQGRAAEIAAVPNNSTNINENLSVFAVSQTSILIQWIHFQQRITNKSDHIVSISIYRSYPTLISLLAPIYLKQAESKNPLQITLCPFGVRSLSSKAISSLPGVADAIRIGIETPFRIPSR